VLTRMAASIVLLAMPLASLAAPRASFEALLADLKSPNAKTRQAAAAALGKSRKREAVSALSAVVRDPESKVRLEVVRSLRELRETAGVPALVTAADSGSESEPEIRKDALSALVDLYVEFDRPTGWERFLGASDDYEDVRVAHTTTVDPMAVRALTGALRDDEKEIREQAVLSLGIVDARGSLRDLVAALQDPEPNVRGAAAAAIAKLQGSEHSGSLIALLTDPETSVRVRALQALGSMRIKDAVAPLREMFEANRKKEIGVRVLEALARIGDPSQADLFRELLQDGDGPRMRLAVEGLARLSDTTLLPAFKKDFQREDNEELKLAYAFGIAMLGDRAFLDTLVRGLSSKFDRRCRQYLLELGRPALGDLYEYLSYSAADVRASLCQILGEMGDGETITRLQPLVNDPNTEVADSANRAIEHLKRSSAAVASSP
jgi:HEAT repeat protein